MTTVTFMDGHTQEVTPITLTMERLDEILAMRGALRLAVEDNERTRKEHPEWVYPNSPCEERRAALGSLMERWEAESLRYIRESTDQRPFHEMTAYAVSGTELTPCGTIGSMLNE